MNLKPIGVINSGRRN